MKASQSSLSNVSNTPSKEDIPYISPLKTPFSRTMMANSRTFSRKFTTRNTERNSSRRKYGMNTD
jgi:hypothetical protein